MESIFNSTLMFVAIISGYVIIGMIVAGFSLGMLKYGDGEPNPDYSPAWSVLFWPFVVWFLLYDFVLRPLWSRMAGLAGDIVGLIATITDLALRGVTGKVRKTPSAARPLPATFVDRTGQKEQDATAGDTDFIS